MEFIKFRIQPVQKIAFEQAFHEILNEGNIVCHQWGFGNNKDFVIAEIPKYAVDKMTSDQIQLLNSFI